MLKVGAYLRGLTNNLKFEGGSLFKGAFREIEIYIGGCSVKNARRRDCVL